MIASWSYLEMLSLERLFVFLDVSNVIPFQNVSHNMFSRSLHAVADLSVERMRRERRHLRRMTN